jgi:hypothetical protein
MSKIALIAAEGASVREWRIAACVDEEESPWIRFMRDLEGRTFCSVICLPGWQRRPLNAGLLERIQPMLVAPSQREIDTEMAQAEVEIRTNIMNRAIDNGVDRLDAARAALNARLSEDQFIDQAEAPDLYDSVIDQAEAPDLYNSGVGEARGTRDPEIAFPSVPVVAAHSDEAYCMSHPLMTPALFGRMGETARAHFADLMRRNRNMQANTFINEAAAMFGVRISSPSPPRPSILPFADNFRDVARQERQREAERQERINAGRLRAEEMRRNIRRNLD